MSINTNLNPNINSTSQQISSPSPTLPQVGIIGISIDSFQQRQYAPTLARKDRFFIIVNRDTLSCPPVISSTSIFLNPPYSF